MLAVINESKVKGSWCTLFQVYGEQWVGQAGEDIGEEGLLRGWLDGVQGIKGQSEKAVVLSILLELSADILCELDSLTGEGGLPNRDGVGVDIAARAALISIGDAPSSSRQLLGGG